MHACVYDCSSSAFAFFFFNFLQVCLMHSIIKKLHVNKFRPLLQEGSMYVISNFKVIRSLGLYQVINNPLRMSFMLITKVKQTNDLASRIPMHKFHFADLQTLYFRINDNSFLTNMWALCLFFCFLWSMVYKDLFLIVYCNLIDVIGVLVGVGEVKKVRSKGIPKKELQLCKSFF